MFFVRSSTRPGRAIPDGSVLADGGLAHGHFHDIGGALLHQADRIGVGIGEMAGQHQLSDPVTVGPDLQA